jgi:outer membrane protein OmpA-like peptidoglycan-associated protein
MPGYWIHHCAAKQFDAKTIPIAEGKTASVEGRTWEAAYFPQATSKDKPSEIQILRNFENAVSTLGGTVQASSKSRRTFKVAREGKEFWVELWAEFTGKYGLIIIEKAAMNQDVVASAEVFSNDLKNTGHAAVYGIWFDTGKSEIKPESAQAVGEIAKLLAADAKLKLFVVGHTDNVGTLEGNMRLSQERAEAVVQALMRTHGIAAARLKSFGSGPYSPVASNDAETGRSKNRRVELVKQ